MSVTFFLHIWSCFIGRNRDPIRKLKIKRRSAKGEEIAGENLRLVQARATAAEGSTTIFVLYLFIHRYKLCLARRRAVLLADREVPAVQVLVVRRDLVVRHQRAAVRAATMIELAPNAGIVCIFLQFCRFIGSDFCALLVTTRNHLN